MIDPEVGHHFVELTFAVDGAQELRLRELSLNHQLGIDHRQQRFFLLRSEAVDHALPCLLVQRTRHHSHVVRTHLHQILEALIGRLVHQRLSAFTAEFSLDLC